MFEKLIYIAVAVVFGLVGYGYGTNEQQLVTDELMLKYETKVSELRKENEQTLLRREDSLSKTIDQLRAQVNAERDHNRVLNTSLERMRNDSSSLRAKLASNKNSAVVDEKSIGRCVELIQTGSELLGQCSKVLRSNASEHDALAGLVK